MQRSLSFDISVFVDFRLCSSNWSNCFPFFLFHVYGKRIDQQSGNPLDTDAHIKLLHQQPHLGGSGMTMAKMSPLMRHKPLLNFKQAEADQLWMGGASCNALTTQHQMTSPDGSTKTLIQPLSQSSQYLARPSSQMCQQTSLTNLVGSGYTSDSNQGHERNIDDSHQTPQLELTLVYVSASAQLLVHVHRLSNVTLVRHGKESGNAAVKVNNCMTYSSYICVTHALRHSNYDSRISSLHFQCLILRLCLSQPTRPDSFHGKNQRPFLFFLNLSSIIKLN